MDGNNDYEVSRFFNRTGTKALTEARDTPVILVCIYNKNSTLITHELLHTVFSTYGKILRVNFSSLSSHRSRIRFSSLKKSRSGKPLLSSPLSKRLWKLNEILMISFYLAMALE